MKCFKEETRVFCGYFAALILFILCFLLVTYLLFQREEYCKQVTVANHVETNIQHLLSTLQHTEIAYRGNIIAKDDMFLQLLYVNSHRSDSLIKVLNDRFENDPVQLGYIQTINNKIDEYYLSCRSAFIDKTPVKSRSITSKFFLRQKNIDDIKKNIENVLAVEDERLVLKKNLIHESIMWYISAAVFVLISAIVLFLYSLMLHIGKNKENNRRKKESEKHIEELDQANQELIEQKRTEQFVASGRIFRTIAHEVRNPLTNISLATEQLGVGLPENDDNLFLIDIVKRNAARINTLMGELLNSTKFTELEIADVTIEQVFEDALELTKDRLTLNGVKVIRQYASNRSTLKIDKEKMKTALVNLIVNAIEAMEPHKGILQVSTQKKGNTYVLKVKDNGIGMSKNTLLRIFEPYFTQKENGQGLGLTLAQNIILSHRGYIDVESNPGEGSVFIVSLKVV